MLPTRRKVSILMPLGFSLDVFKKIACGFARVSVISPSRYFVREQCCRGRGLWRVRGGAVTCAASGSRCALGPFSTLDPPASYADLQKALEDKNSSAGILA